MTMDTIMFGGKGVELRIWQIWAELCVERIRELAEVLKAGDADEAGPDEALEAIAQAIIAGQMIGGMARMVVVCVDEHDEEVHRADWACTTRIGAGWDGEKGKIAWTGMQPRGNWSGLEEISGWDGAEQWTCDASMQVEGEAGEEQVDFLIDTVRDLVEGLTERANEIETLDREEERLDDAGKTLFKLTWQTAWTVSCHAMALTILKDKEGYGDGRAGVRTTVRVEEEAERIQVAWRHRWIWAETGSGDINAITVNHEGGAVDALGGKYGVAPGAAMEQRIAECERKLKGACGEELGRLQHRIAKLEKKQGRRQANKTKRLDVWAHRTAVEASRTSERILVDRKAMDVSWGRRLVVELQERMGRERVLLADPEEMGLGTLCGMCGWATEPEHGKECPACGLMHRQEEEGERQLEILGKLGAAWKEAEKEMRKSLTLEEMAKRERAEVQNAGGASWRCNENTLRELRKTEKGGEEGREHRFRMWWADIGEASKKEGGETIGETGGTERILH